MRTLLVLCSAATATAECIRGDCRGPDTYGVFNYASGAEYEGTWNGEGLRHGLGVWHGPHGAARYDGEFADGKKQGVGVNAWLPNPQAVWFSQHALSFGACSSC